MPSTDLLILERAAWGIDLAPGGHAARGREQVVAPARKLVLGSPVEMQHVGRRVREHVARARHARIAAARAAARAPRVVRGMRGVAPPPSSMGHPYIGGVAMHGLQQRRVAVECEPVDSVDEEVARDMLVVSASTATRMMSGER